MKHVQIIGDMEQSKIDTIFNYVANGYVKLDITEYFWRDSLFIRQHQEIRNIIKTYVDGIILEGKGNPIDAIRLIESLDDPDSDYNFGEIQWLINVVAKYMYVAIAYNNDEMKEKFKDCHYPIDKYVIKNLGVGECVDGVFDERIYHKCQSIIRDKCEHPLDFDTEYWDVNYVINNYDVQLLLNRADRIIKR